MDVDSRLSDYSHTAHREKERKLQLITSPRLSILTVLCVREASRGDSRCLQHQSQNHYFNYILYTHTYIDTYMTSPFKLSNWKCTVIGSKRNLPLKLPNKGRDTGKEGKLSRASGKMTLQLSLRYTSQGTKTSDNSRSLLKRFEKKLLKSRSRVRRLSPKWKEVIRDIWEHKTSVLSKKWASLHFWHWPISNKLKTVISFYIFF